MTQKLCVLKFFPSLKLVQMQVSDCVKKGCWISNKSCNIFALVATYLIVIVSLLKL